MEKIYQFKYNDITGLKKALVNDDYISHIDHSIRDFKSVGTDIEGYFLYIKGSEQEIKYIEEKLKDIKVTSLEGETKDSIINTIHTEEENAASGIGLMFG